MSLPAGRGQRLHGRPRATGLPAWRKVVVRASAVTTLLTALLLFGYYGLYTLYVINEILTNADTQDRGWLTPFGMGFPAILGVGLLVGGLDQWHLRDDHKLSAVMLGVLSMPMLAGVRWPEDPQLGRTWPGEGLLIAAVVLCAAATWILHTAHRATPQPERID